MTAVGEPEAGGRLRYLLLPPQFSDADQRARAHILYGLALASAVTSVVGNVANYALAAAGPRWLLLMLMQLFIALLTLLLIQARHVTAAAWFLIVASWAGNAFAAWTVGGLGAPSIFAQLIIVLAAGLIFGWRSTLAAAAAALAVVVCMAWAGSSGALPQPALTHNPWSRANVIACYVVLAAVMVAIATWNLRRARAATLQEVTERVAAEAALAESRAVLSAVVEGTTDAIFVKDRDGSYLFVNSAGGETLRMDPEDIVGKDDFALFPQDRAAALQADDERVMAAGDVITREQYLSHGGSALRCQLVTKGPLKTDDGTIIGVYGMARDISERKHAEERMRATLTSLLDPHTVLQAVRNGDGQIVDFLHLDANEAAAEYLGISRERIVGSRFLDLLPEGVDLPVLRHWTDIVETRRPLVLDDYPMLSSQGENRRFDMRGVRVGDGLSFTWRNVTERHEMEAALRRRVEELDALERVSRLLAAPGNLSTTLARASEEITALFDARHTRVRLLPEADADDGLTEELEVAAAAGDAALALSADTDEAGSNLLTVPLVSGSRTIGALVVARDRSAPPFGERELRVVQPLADAVAAAVENERLHRREKRQAAQAERQRLARDLHDAVTQSIYAASLIARSLPALWEQSPEDGLTHLAALRRLVRAALAEMRTLLFELRPATLEETPLETLLQRLGEALEGHVDVDVEIAVAPDFSLPSDVKLVFYRIAQEALSNVGKYAQASRVRADVTGDEAAARLTVRDNGRGFDPTMSRPDSLGLRIMRERADEIGAVVTVESALGRGTVVTVTWPRPNTASQPRTLTGRGVRRP